MGDRVGVGLTLPDSAFDGVDESGAARTIRLGEYAGDGRLLVVRVQGGAWCGPCAWHASHTRELVEGERGARVRVLDVILADRQNAPATARDASSWRASLDTTAHVAVVADPGFSMRPLLEGALPIVALVDTRSMKLVSAESNPDPSSLDDAIDAALSITKSHDETLVDGLFHRNEWDMIRAIETPPTPNAGDPRAIALGKAFFEDTALSPANVGCATCHDSSRAFADDLPVAMGASRGDRHTPRIALAASSPFQFWDGRETSLESQVLGPIENPKEMASSRAFVAKHVSSTYAAALAEIFPDAQGDDGVIVAVERAIAAYERSLRVAPNALDAYARGDFAALSFPQKQGLVAFAREGCMQCHWGPRLTDDAFHVTRTPTGRADGQPDEGRAGHLGAFKTPSLRGIASAHYFGHGGVADSLDAMVALYGDGVVDARSTGEREPWLPRFGETTRWSILKVLETIR